MRASDVKVVFVGSEKWTGSARLQILREQCDEVRVFDHGEYLASRPLLGWIEARTVHGPVHADINRRLLALCDEFRPDALWVEKGYWIWPSTLERLKSRGVFLAQHNTDKLSPARLRMRWDYRLLRKTLPYYDVYLTTNKIDYKELSEAGRPVAFSHLGYDHLRFDDSPAEEVGEPGEFPLIFIGHYEPRTEDGVLALAEAGLPVTVFGPNWHRARYKKRLADHVRFRSPSDVEYVSLIKRAKIGLGFVSAWNGNDTSSRSFEIPACGTFLLALRTPQHLECYEEGREAEFFGDDAELVRKAKYYLEHDDERRAVARRGHERCVGGDYSWARYMRNDWAAVLEAMAARGGRSAAAPEPAREAR